MLQTLISSNPCNLLQSSFNNDEYINQEHEKYLKKDQTNRRLSNQITEILLSDLLFTIPNKINKDSIPSSLSSPPLSTINFLS